MGQGPCKVFLVLAYLLSTVSKIEFNDILRYIGFMCFGPLSLYIPPQSERITRQGSIFALLSELCGISSHGLLPKLITYPFSCQVTHQLILGQVYFQCPNIFFYNMTRVQNAEVLWWKGLLNHKGFADMLE
jgi:hypothetical protein